jgi:hypothetical protein
MNRVILLKKVAQANIKIQENQPDSTVQIPESSQNVDTSIILNDSSFNIESGDFCTKISKIKRNIKPKTIMNSGPFDYKMIFENKDYPHSVNLTKLNFAYKINNEDKSKLLFLSTGHSFAESHYKTESNIKIEKTNQIEQIFTNSNSNIFYSLDNGFDDFCLLSFDSNLNIEQTNYLPFNGSNYIINSICRNMDIKFLENEILIKNGHNTGETKTKAIINFETDVYLTSKKNKSTYFTFKINGYIVIISSKFASGIVVRAESSSISKYNGEQITDNKYNELLEYYFISSIKEFKHHELFLNINLNLETIKTYYIKYKETGSLSIASAMGDSGSGFFRLMPENKLEFVGINIGGCPMIVLSENKPANNLIQWSNEKNKLVFGKYVVEGVYRACQVLPINQIKELINKNLPTNITLKEITV